MYQTAVLVMQTSPAALHAETGVVRAGLAALQIGLAVNPQSLGKMPRGIVAMRGGSGEAAAGVAVMPYQPAEMPNGVVGLVWPFGPDHPRTQNARDWLED